MNHKRAPTIVTVAVFAALAAGGVAQDKPASEGDKIRALMQARVEVLTRVAEIGRQQHDQGALDLAELLNAEAELLDARLELALVPEVRIALRESQVDLALRREQHAASLARDGEGSAAEALRAKSNRLSAEIELLREKQR